MRNNFFFFTFLILWNPSSATFLKNKEIEQLQLGVDDIKSSILSLDEKISKVDKSHIERYDAINKKLDDLYEKYNTVDMLQSRMISAELKLQLLEQPGTPSGTPSRRPEIRRRGSSQTNQYLSPRSFRDDRSTTDYFSPTSPYS
jgi:hypothetical protein